MTRATDERDDLLRRYADIALAASGDGDLDAAVSGLHRLPASLPGRGRLAAALLGALVREPKLDMSRLRRVESVLAVAENDPPASPKWTSTRAAARAVALLVAAAEDRVADPRAAMAELEKLAAEAGMDTSASPFFESVRQGLAFLAAMHEGDESALRRLPERLERLHAMSGDAYPLAQPLTDLMTASAEMMAANQRGDDLTEPMRRVREAAESLPPDDPVRAAALEGLSMAGDLSGVPSGGKSTGLDDADPVLRYTHAAAVLLRGGEETDLGKIEAAIVSLREALRLARPEDVRRPLHLSGLALAIFRRTEVTNSIAGLDEAVTLLTEARELAGGPHHPQWSWINDLLSGVQQRLGSSAPPHRTGLDAMRGHTFRVMLQSDLAAATVAAADAARSAVDTARWCLQANEPADAITALDAGRGLALFAATEVGTVGTRLRMAGRAALADRWDAAVASGDPDQLPTVLRRDALAVLTEQGSPAVLDPPGLDEIRDALHTLDADALVYLVPGLPGWAVIAPAEGRAGYIPLPNLQPDGDLDVERYLNAAARRASRADPDRDMEPDDDADEAFTDSLDALCRWAWRAAMGPLVEQYLPRLSRRANGRPPRVVLVPMGNLALIPWQAARHPDGRYAVELVAISQAVSARMLCHAAALSPVPLAPTGLVVGDPDTGDPARDLLAARAEAHTVRRAFYPGARYIGRRPNGSTSPSGSGGAGEVRAWLTATGPAAGAMLHLACHGFTSASAGTAYLLLAGGDRLTAETLGTVMARNPERAIGLVVLAACRTGRTISGYDEAYSLGTAFLAAGVRSVLSTQWSVPDRATSVLMFMFHHYLMAGRRPVWAALREAQLWMLDPRRQVPSGMPDELRVQLAGADLTAVAAWAGFVHWGQ